MTGWRLLLTRPAEECEALAATLAEAGVHSSSLPLLAIEPLTESAEQRAMILELDRYCAVVVVSKPAARLGLELLDRYWPQPPFGQPWFVGGATGAILEAYGLDVSWPERGDDSEALLALPRLAQALARPDPKVLIMRGEGGRELEGLLHGLPRLGPLRPVPGDPGLRLGAVGLHAGDVQLFPGGIV